MGYNGYQILQVISNQWVVKLGNEILYVGNSYEDCENYIKEVIKC